MKPEQLLERIDLRWRRAKAIDDQVLNGLDVSTQDVRDFVQWIRNTQALLFHACQIYEETFDKECECHLANVGAHCPLCSTIGRARSIVYQAVQKHPFLHDDGKPQPSIAELRKELYGELGATEPIPSEAATRQTFWDRYRAWFQRHVLSRFK